ncbi:hypothetical protein P8452_71351 [Trifolium repens]|nr:hypothetical protein P8452_71351 [Trifolium repens]
MILHFFCTLVNVHRTFLICQQKSKLLSKPSIKLSTRNCFISIPNFIFQITSSLFYTEQLYFSLLSHQAQLHFRFFHRYQAPMARALDFIKDINDGKELWKFAVRLEDIWKTGIGKGEHLEFLILDKQVHIYSKILLHCV